MVDDCYPFRENFQDAVRWLRKSRKLQLAEVAKILGLSLDTLHDYLYKRKNRPGRDPLKILSKETGRPMADFDDDPGAPPTGTTDESSEIDRFMLRVMGSDLNSLTDGQKQSAFEAWRAIVKGYGHHK